CDIVDTSARAISDWRSSCLCALRLAEIPGSSQNSWQEPCRSRPRRLGYSREADAEGLCLEGKLHMAVSEGPNGGSTTITRQRINASGRRQRLNTMDSRPSPRYTGSL